MGRIEVRAPDLDGPPSKQRGDPTATDTQGGPATPGTPGRSSQAHKTSEPPPAARPRPRQPRKTTRDPSTTTGKPPRLPPAVHTPSVHPPGPTRTGGGLASRAERHPEDETGPDPCPRTADPAACETRDTGADGEPLARGVGAGHAVGGRERPPRPQPKPHAHAPERARGNTPARNAALLRDGRRPPARRNPPPTRRGEARATVGARATSCVVARPLKVGARERGPSARTQKAATERASRGGAAAGGSGTPRHPLGSLEKGFLTEGASSPRQRKHPIGPAKPHFRATLGAGGGARGRIRPGQSQAQGTHARHERSR